MKKAILTQGLLYGDEGKGTIVDSLCRRYDASTVVRYSGSSNCGHNVVLDDGLHFCFSQFGSGHLIPDTKTFLGKGMLINPVFLMAEEQELWRKGYVHNYERLFIDSRALVITPFHVAFNRLLEMSRGASRHGSTGHGTWECVKDNVKNPDLSIRVRDLKETDLMVKLAAIGISKRDSVARLPKNIKPEQEEEWNSYVGLFWDTEALIDIRNQYRQFIELVNVVNGADQISSLLSGVSILEGNQGVALDDVRGFSPHHCATSCTFENANALLKEVEFNGKVERIGILRTFSTRHGAGPFVSQDARLRHLIKDDHNQTNPWQGTFKVGQLDLPMLRYCKSVIGHLDGLALTHCDKITKYNPVVTEYYHSGQKLLSANGATTGMLREIDALSETIDGDDLVDLISDELDTPIFIKSYGPAHKDKKYIPSI